MKKALKTAGLTTVGVISAAAAQASDLGLGVGEIAELSGNTNESTFQEAIGNGLSFVFGIMGLVAVVVVLIGGWQTIVSGGDESKVANARKLIVYGVVGILVIAAAWLIASFALSAIGEIVGNEVISQTGQI